MNKRKKTMSVVSAQSRDEVVAKIKEIGDLERERERLQAEMNDQIAILQEQYAQRAAQLDAQIKAHTASCHLWCEANRAELTENHRVKSADLTTGVVKWRVAPPSVTVSGKADVIDYLLTHSHLKRFVREKLEINRELILQHAELFAEQQVPGIKIKTGEEFFVIEPFQQDLTA